MQLETPPTNSLVRTTIAACFGFALVQLDVSIVNVALPQIAEALGGGMSTLQWIVDAYALSFAALLLTGGALGDRIGSRRVYLTGLAIFAAASLGCGLAPDTMTLIFGRVVQGLGAALMLPSSLALINHAAAGDSAARAKAVSWWTAAGAITIAAGPLVGGLLVEAASWRSIFLVNLPICMIGAWLALRLPETDAHRSRGVDWAGQVLGVVALAGITAAVIEVRPHGPASAIVLGLAATGIAAALAFVAVERRQKAPMLPLSLFANAGFNAAVFYGIAVNLTYYGMVFVLSLYLQRVLGYSPMTTGFAYLPLTATFFVVNVVSGVWVSRAGSRVPMITGALIDACGFALLLLTAANTSYWLLLPAFALMPVGMGLGVPAMTNAVLSSVERAQSGIAAAVLNAARQAGGAIGVALFGSLAGDEAHHIVGGLHLSAIVAIVLLLAAAAVAARWIGDK